MKKGNKEILVTGDRFLIVPDLGEDRSNSGLYLPKWAVEKESVQGGRIVEAGPGWTTPTIEEIQDEPWKPAKQEMDDSEPQGKIGDYAIFLRKSAVEVKLDKDTYLIVPQAAILLLIRDKED